MTYSRARIRSVRLKESGCQVIFPSQFVHKSFVISNRCLDERALNVRSIINHLIKYENEITSLIAVVNWDDGISSVRHSGVTPTECALANSLLGQVFGDICEEVSNK